MEEAMHRSAKYFEKALTVAANGAWFVFDQLNRVRPNASFTPNWTEKPLLKSWQKVKPPLGWPLFEIVTFLSRPQ
jgi:hypothetical protein